MSMQVNLKTYADFCIIQDCYKGDSQLEVCISKYYIFRSTLQNKIALSSWIWVHYFLKYMQVGAVCLH